MKEIINILVVSDDAEARSTYIKTLMALDELNIIEAENGLDAISLIKKSTPDIIFCDLTDQPLDSLALCRKLKNNGDHKLSNIYLIVARASESKEYKLRCMNEGADHSLPKPVDPDELLACIKVTRRIASQIHKAEIESRKIFNEIDVLLILDGGCAPGYNPVTAFITHQLEHIGRKAYGAKEGFKSLVSGEDADFLRLVYDPALFKKMDHIPGVFHAAPLSEWRGAQMRSERYKEFKKKEVQEKAAKTILDREVQAIIAIGGNGTFAGLKALCELLPTSIQIFFIPVTIDSDIAGTECIGEYTGIEIGAEKIRCYMADARTHKRTYIIEMMGASSGFHALNSCLGSRAHMAVLPNSVIDHKKTVEALNNKDECVIVVAEGYKKEDRETNGSTVNAAEYFYKELLDTGIEIKRRVVCEPFSRDIRGAAPNNLDITLAQRMAYNVAAYMKAGTSRLMPAVRSGREYAIPFNEIQTDNMVKTDLLALSNRLTKD